MEREPLSTKESLETEIDGRRYRGERVMLTISDDEIRQEIRFRSLRAVDPRPHRPGEAAAMVARARSILRDLVEHWKELKAARRPVKVERPDQSRSERGRP